MKNRRWRATAFLFTSISLLTGCGLEQDISERADLSSSRVVVAPELRGSTLGGAHFDLAAHRGRPVVIDFWASWCGPCRKQQPDLDRLAHDFTPRGATFIGVDLRDDHASGLAYIADFGVPYPSLEDPYGDIADRFDVPAPPTTVIVDGSGRIIRRVLGGVRYQDLAPMLSHVLSP